MSTHALYRFFGVDEALLYIGITCNPGARWGNHEEKPWWHEVARITLETFPDRESVLRAEAAAIAAERPRYNVKHNGNGKAVASPAAAKAINAFLNAGEVVALGLKDGTCPVGIIVALDEEWVRLDLLSFLDGGFGFQTTAVRRDEIQRAMAAREMSREECEAEGHCWDRSKDRICFDTDPLWDFNTSWRAEHGDPKAIAHLNATHGAPMRRTSKEFS